VCAASPGRAHRQPVEEDAQAVREPLIEYGRPDVATELVQPGNLLDVLPIERAWT
jgi:hypothetical protein